ncbi:hypothetical protein [Cognatilysobacter terrigena]|nr:hypothetical protein [Lysobacter terrigena]
MSLNNSGVNLSISVFDRATTSALSLAHLAGGECRFATSNMTSHDVF